MPLGYPIEPIIKKTLDKKRKVLSRTKTSDPFSPRDKTSKEEYQENVIKSTYIFMVSAPVFEQGEVARGKMPSGTIILGNQEYNKRADKSNFGIDLYGSKTSKGMTGYQDMRYFLKTGKKDKRYKPTAGVTSLSSEFISSNNVQFIRHITISWSCFTLEDLEELSERFLTLGRKVYVEWGLAQNKNRPQLINSEGQVDISDLEVDEDDSEATRLRKKVIKVGEGNFDAAIGWVNNFNWTSREDGGFDCTTEITVQGVNALEGPTDINYDNVESGKPKFKENTSEGFGKFSFSKALQDLPRTAKQYHSSLVQEFGVKGASQSSYGMDLSSIPLYQGYKTAKGITIETSDAGQTGTYIEPNVTSENLMTNKNFIVTQLLSKTSDDIVFDPQGDDKNWYNFRTDSSEEQALDDISNQNAYVNPNNAQYPPEKCWVRWGWFEDNMLNKFFALIDTKNNIPISQFRSKELIKEQRDLVEEFEARREPKKYKFSKDGGRVYRTNIETGKKEFSHFEGRETNEEYLDNYDGSTIGATDPDDKGVEPKYESSTTNTHKDFKTSDISKFIFPGKFNIEIDESVNRLRTESIQKERQKLQKQLGSDVSNPNFKGKYDQERKLANEIKRLDAELQATSDAQKNIDTYFRNENGELKSIQELRKSIQSFKVTTDNLNFTESGIIPYLTLISLSNEVKKLQEFQTRDDENSGYTRNIFINVKHLQDMFSNPSATLGENLNTLFDSLTRETAGLSDLMIVADNTRIGNLKMEERGIDSKEAKKLKKLEQQGAIYEFPVLQSDSFVKSQELSSDISSENYKILLSKSYNQRIKLEKKKGISLIHHANINALDSNGIIKPKDERYDGVASGVKVAFEVDKNFGQTDGDINQSLGTKGANVVPYNIDDLYAEEISKKRKGDSEKDLEQQNNIFRELDIAYTTSGKLKSHLYEEMKELVGFRETQVIQDDDTEYIVRLPNVNDYGQVGITNTLSMEGIAGIYPSNIYTTSYLPQKFKDHCHFYTTDVEQSIDSSAWTTTISGRMVWKYVGVKTNKKNKFTEQELQEIEDNSQLEIRGSGPTLPNF